MDKSKKKKILFVVNYLSGGGMEQMLINVIRSISDSFHLEVLTIYDIKSFYLDEVKAISKVSTLDKSRLKFDTFGLRSIYSRFFDRGLTQRVLFKQFLKNRKFDIVIAFSEGYALNLIAGVKMPQTKKLAWIHTDFLNDENWIDKHKKKLQRTFYKFDDVVFVCENLRNKFSKLLLLNKTTCIPNGIDLDRIKKLAEEKNLQKTNDRIEFVSVGRLGNEKGHDRILSCLARLNQDERERCHLTIIGGGEMEHSLKELVEKAHLKKYVTFTGAIPNPFPYIKSADALILASKYEGFGLVIIESLALGTPVMATETIGSSNVLMNGEYGLLVKNDEESIEIAIRSLICNFSQMNKYLSKMTNRANDFSLDNLKRNLVAYFTNE